MRSIIRFNLVLVTLCAASVSYAAQLEVLISAPGATISVEFESPVEAVRCAVHAEAVGLDFDQSAANSSASRGFTTKYLPESRD